MTFKKYVISSFVGLSALTLISTNNSSENKLYSKNNIEYAENVSYSPCSLRGKSNYLLVNSEGSFSTLFCDTILKDSIFDKDFDDNLSHFNGLEKVIFFSKDTDWKEVKLNPNSNNSSNFFSILGLKKMEDNKDFNNYTKHYQAIRKIILNN